MGPNGECRLQIAECHRGEFLTRLFRPRTSPPPRASSAAEGWAVDEFPGSREFLASTDVVDWYHPDVQTAAWFLGGRRDRSASKIAKRCFEWVRDEIQHCMDFQRTEVTCRASEVLTHGTGFCYAKSHLLAAVCARMASRPASAINVFRSTAPASHSVCTDSMPSGLPDHGWYRVDARGNKAGRDVLEFDPPHEQLAFATQLPGERMLPEILAEPLPSVVDVLRQHSTVAAVGRESARFASN